MVNGPYRRSKSDRKIAGVCGGLAKYFGMDPTLVRVLWVVLTLVSFGAGLVGYILLWVLAPEE
jgi:phage shock protein C